MSAPRIPAESGRGRLRHRLPVRRRVAAAATVIMAACLVVMLTAIGAGTIRATDAGAGTDLSDPATIARGEYLARVGNCAGCHTAPGGDAYAGGRGIPTPFGTVYPGNLTADAATGLGRWSSADFWRAMHEGRGRDGRRLVPAFPYTAYTHVRREDSDAIFAWLRTLPVAEQPSRPHALRFPYGTQTALAAWQWLFFRPGEPATAMPASGGAAPDATSRDRGEYLVKGLGHCAACHAPRNRWGGSDDSLVGGEIPGLGWVAPTLHPAANATRDDLIAYLRTGRNPHDSASGPMAGVVMQSTQHWTGDDLQAAADWLLSLPPRPATPGTAVGSSRSTSARGERLYADRCADCHGRDGRGLPDAYPPLAGNPTVLLRDPRNLVQVVRHGAFGPVTAGRPRPFGMPPIDLGDADLATVLTHIRQAWGNDAAAVSAVDVLRRR